MPRSPAPEWRRRKEPVLDDYVRASIDGVNGEHDPETGFYATLHYAGCETRERATEIRQALFRAANHVKVSMNATVLPADDGTFFVEFRAIHKSYGRNYIKNKANGDRRNLAYDPRKKGN